jgi:hypothetical protein
VAAFLRDTGINLLEKPYTQAELIRRIRALLNRGAARG